VLKRQCRSSRLCPVSLYQRLWSQRRWKSNQYMNGRHIDDILNGWKRGRPCSGAQRRVANGNDVCADRPLAEELHVLVQTAHIYCKPAISFSEQFVLQRLHTERHTHFPYVSVERRHVVVALDSQLKHCRRTRLVGFTPVSSV